MFECTALQLVQDQYPMLFRDNILTMEDFMWQGNTVQVGKFIMQCFAYKRGDNGW